MKNFLLKYFFVLFFTFSEPLNGAASCAECQDEDLTVPEAMPDGCDSIMIEGGLAGWAAVRCDYDFTDINSQAEWEAQIAAGIIRGRFNPKRVKGTKPKATEKTISGLGACGTDEVLYYEETWSITDVENDSTYSLNPFYCYFDTKGIFYNYYFFNSKGETYGPIKPLTVSGGNVDIPETCDDVVRQYLDVKVRRPKGQCLTPVLLPFISKLKGLTNGTNA